MNHIMGQSLVRKDQARRIKFQDTQRLQQQTIENVGNDYGIKLSKGQLKSFLSKLVK